MAKIFLACEWSCLAVVGVVLLDNAQDLSKRYNLWTSSLRRRSPQINPPPNPKMRETNTRIMTWTIRSFALLLILMAGFALFDVVRSD